MFGAGNVPRDSVHHHGQMETEQKTSMTLFSCCLKVSKLSRTKRT